MNSGREYQDHEDQAAYDRGYMRQRLRDAGWVGLGSGLGGVAGWGAGELVKKFAKPNPKLSGIMAAAMPAISAGLAGYGTYLINERENLKNSKAHRSGQAEVEKSRPQVKTAAIVNGPGHWSHTEKGTVKGALAGGAIGLGVAGLTSGNPTFMKFGLPAAAIGAFMGRRKAKQQMG